MVTVLRRRRPFAGMKGVHVLLQPQILLVAGLGHVAFSVALGLPTRAAGICGATFVTAFGYTLNKLTDVREDRVNDRERSRLVARHRQRLVLLCVVLAGVVVASAWRLPPAGAIALVTCLALALVYSVPILPRATRLKDLPLAKTLSAALGWAAVMVVLPVAAAAAVWTPPRLAAASYVFAIASAIEIVHDLRDLRGDRAAGVGSIPVLFGARRSAVAAISFSVVAALVSLLAYPEIRSAWLLGANGLATGTLIAGVRRWEGDRAACDRLVFLEVLALTTLLLSSLP